jgi:hypothetical protein
MDRQMNDLLGEIALLEIKTSEFYRLLWYFFPESSTFWAGLCGENECFALIMQCAKEQFIEERLSRIRSLDPDLAITREKIARIDETIAEYRCRPPARERALLDAVKMELSLGELYLDFSLTLPLEPGALDHLRDLIGANESHVGKILKEIREFCEEPAAFPPQVQNAGEP